MASLPLVTCNIRIDQTNRNASKTGRTAPENVSRSAAKGLLAFSRQGSGWFIGGFCLVWRGFGYLRCGVLTTPITIRVQISNANRRTASREGPVVSAHAKSTVTGAPDRQTLSANLIPLTVMERLRLIREWVAAEGNAILSCANNLTPESVRAAELTAECDGCVIVTGVGKAGLVGQKLVATLASTGTPAHFLHPAEAVHGDLGRVRSNDLVWAFSNSGRSEEVVRIASHLREHASGLVAITANDNNPLAVAADCVVAIGKHNEACPNGLAPTSSTAVMMAVGDSIAMMASQLRQFSPQDFAKFHPGGSLGRKLARVDQLMRPLDSCRVTSSATTIRAAMIATSKTGRRSGAVMLTDESGQLVGIFTDSDLARLLESRSENAFDQSIDSQMTKQPLTILGGTLLSDAIALMSHRKISELPVVTETNEPIGMLDITDLMSLGDDAQGAPTIPLNQPKLDQ